MIVKTRIGPEIAESSLDQLIQNGPRFSIFAGPVPPEIMLIFCKINCIKT